MENIFYKNTHNSYFQAYKWELQKKNMKVVEAVNLLAEKLFDGKKAQAYLPHVLIKVQNSGKK